MTLSAWQLFGLMFGTAILSSVLTLVVMHLVFTYHITPDIERNVYRRLDAGAAQLEEKLRRRFAEALAGQTAVLRDRARGIAKTGIDILSQLKTSSPPRSDDK